jgi:hypothetical protein
MPVNPDDVIIVISMRAVTHFDKKKLYTRIIKFDTYKSVTIIT